MPDSSNTSVAKNITFSDGSGNGNGNGNGRKDGAALRRVVSYSRTWWKFKMRDDNDDEDVYVAF